MAITGSLTINGVVIQNAYVQVYRVFGGPKEGGFNAVVRVYASQAIRQANEAEFLFQKNLSSIVPYDATKAALDTVYAALQAAGGDYAGFVSC